MILTMIYCDICDRYIDESKPYSEITVKGRIITPTAAYSSEPSVRHVCNYCIIPDIDTRNFVNLDSLIEALKSTEVIITLREKKNATNDPA